MLFCRLLDFFFKINIFDFFSGIPSVCETFWIQIRPDNLSGLIWVQTVCKGYHQTAIVGKELMGKSLIKYLHVSNMK